MIEIKLKYPVNNDVLYYNLPLPENICIRDVCILKFKAGYDYSGYLNMICDIVDELEYSLFFNNNVKNAEKIKFCKRYTEYLMNTAIPLNGIVS